MMKAFRLPGLVDLHVHLRDPGQTHKEDFYTGTSAALAGGYTAIFDMPNNAVPITTFETLQEKIDSAKTKTVCDIGFYFGSLGDNLAQFASVRDKVFGLKLFLNVTTGNYLLDPDNLTKIYEAWPAEKLILLHAEADIISTALQVVKRTNHPTHICHVSSQSELTAVMRAKDKGLPVSCGITPHHLFLSNQAEAALGAFAKMKPALKPPTDQEFLWQNLDAIDVIESDHAPHAKHEKESDDILFGVPGLETTLPMLLQAEREGRISRQQIINMCCRRPAEILGIKQPANTYIEVEPADYEVDNAQLKTKAGWSPFAGRTVFGKVQAVVVRGTKVYEAGIILAKPGSGRVLTP